MIKSGSQRPQHPPPDRRRNHNIPVGGRPVTPLVDFRDNFKSWIDDKALRDKQFLSQQTINSPSPPPILEIRHTSEADPLESRTNSFRTARENLSSDDESYPLDSPSLHPVRQKWLKDTALSSRDVGLGLALEESVDLEMRRLDDRWSRDADTESQVTAKRDSDEKERPQSDSPTLGKIVQNPQVQRRRETSKGNQSEKHKTGNGKRIPSLPSDHNIENMQEKRLSQASTSSTVVEAMVIDSSPSNRRPSLRHTGKLFTLDTDQTATPGKRSLRSSKHADKGLRESFALQSTPSRSSKPGSVTSERSKMVIIPDRRSSLQANVNSRRTSFSQSSRPTTAPETSTRYFNITQHERTPVVLKKVDRSSVSRDDSLAALAATEELARTHHDPPTPTSPGTYHLKNPENQLIRTNRLSSGDWTALPYSLRSYSSTPGTLEVNEATAISIFPHTNESILVIQKLSDGQGSKEHSAGYALISPPIMMRTETEIMDPRDAPVPGFKVIPPTPANAASSSEDTVRLPKRGSRFSAPFTSLRRAMSARRYSESSMSNPFIFTRTLSLRDSPRQQPSLPRDDENQLHPFWRPRRDSDSDNNPVSHRTRKMDMAAPNPKRTMSLTRRFTDSIRSVPRVSNSAILDHSTEPKRTQSLKRLVSNSRPRRATTADWNNQPNYEFVPASERQYLESSYKPHSTGFRNLAERIERRRSLRQEFKSEERRRVLKRRIKPRLMDFG